MWVMEREGDERPGVDVVRTHFARNISLGNVESGHGVCHVVCASLSHTY